MNERDNSPSHPGLDQHRAERQKRLSEWKRTNPDNPPTRGKVYTNGINAEPKANRGYELISFEVDVVALAHEIASTVVKKQKDYGPNNIRRSPYGADKGLVVRMYDKLARIANLTTQERKPENESLRDSFIDIAGYAIIGLMLLDGTFPKEK